MRIRANEDSGPRDWIRPCGTQEQNVAALGATRPLEASAGATRPENSGLVAPARMCAVGAAACAAPGRPLVCVAAYCLGVESVTSEYWRYSLVWTKAGLTRGR